MRIKRIHLYLFIFYLYYIPRFMENTTLINIDGFAEIIDSIKMIAYVLFIGIWLVDMFSKKNLSVKYLLTVIVIILYFAYQAFFKDHADVFGVIVCGLAFREEYLDGYAKNVYRLTCILTLLTICLALTGFIDNNVVTNVKWGGISFSGLACGFTYPGAFMSQIMSIVFLRYYVRRKSITYITNLSSIFIVLVGFLLTQTFYPSLLSLLFIVIINLRIRSKTSNKHRLAVETPLICAGSDLILLGLYGSGNVIGKVADTVVHGRLSLGVSMMKKFGVTLTGTEYVDSLDGKYQILDSEYTRNLVACGVIYFVVSVALMRILLNYSVNRLKNRTLSIIFIILSVNCIFNNGFFNLTCNPFSILLFPALEYALRKNRI